MSEVSKVDHDVAEELEKGLHLHHHLSPRRERAMFATLGFTLALVAPARTAASSWAASTATTSSSG